jgi:hypothetical protein
MAENLYTTLLETTLEYGQGHCRMIEMEKHNESATINYDCVGDKGLDFLDYHIHKICYKLKSNEFIQSMKIVFKNRNDGHLETLLDTAPNEEKTDEYELDDNEEIKEVRIWKKNDSVIGFEITTNKNKSKKFGYGVDEPEKIKEFQNGDKIIFGFGCHANQQYGVCSIYCYYMDKRKYGIVQNSGLLQLRAKLKKNPEFKKEMEDKKASLTPQQKLILETCDLADAAFFPLASYIMTY